MKVATTVCVEPAMLERASAGDDVQWLLALLVTALVVLLIVLAQNEARRGKRAAEILDRVETLAVERAVRP